MIESISACEGGFRVFLSTPKGRYCTLMSIRCQISTSQLKAAPARALTPSAFSEDTGVRPSHRFLFKIRIGWIQDTPSLLIQWLFFLTCPS